ncbi:LysR family transcriptional regulator [Salinactinospora qingdaonensis]|uniref:LysR family transcriptional regulator n=1 Tax=Salinactinospora qingdaonensis TaxID=702744 RepID=A0ABP7F986_9ACTN
MLDLHRLRILREVGRLGSMTAAAAALSYTQPAVSHHINRLEAEVGTPLLTRHGRGVRLTEAGRVLVERVDAVLTELAMAEEEVAAIAGLRGGRVRLAAFPTAAAAVVPDALAALHRRAPGVTVSLVEAEPAEALGLLRAGEVDIALTFRYGDSPPDADTRVHEVFLMSDPVLVVTGADHPCAGQDGLRLADLADQTWASGCERCRDHLVRTCHTAGFEPRVAYATDDYVAIQRLVSRGLAITALPELALTLHRPSGVVVRAVPDLAERRVHAVVVAGARAPAVSVMLDELVAAAAPTEVREPLAAPAPASGATTAHWPVTRGESRGG